MRLKWALSALGIVAAAGLLTTASIYAGANPFNRDANSPNMPLSGENNTNNPNFVNPVPATGGAGSIEPIFADPGDGSGQCQPEVDMSTCDGDMIDGGPASSRPGQSSPNSGDSPTSSEALSEAEVRRLVEKAKQDLAERLSIDPSLINVVHVEYVEWPDGSLGNPNILALYLPVVTSGYRILLEVQGTIFEYHTDTGDRVEWIEFPPVEEPSVNKPAPSNEPDAVGPDMVKSPAPIEGVSVSVAESFPPQYTLNVQYGLSSGCARPAGYEVSPSGDVITVLVLVAHPADPNVVCAMIYGIAERNINLGSDFESGKTYTVQVNDQQVTFTAQ